MKEIYLCRHGETEWTVAKRHTGTTDLPLTDHGKRQSEALCRKLKGIEFGRIWTSPMKRAVETSDIAGFGSAEKVFDAVEWNYGEYEGLTSEEIRQRAPHWDLFQNGAPGGESVAQVRKRAAVLAARIGEGEGRLLLFSHGHFLRALAASWLGWDMREARALFLSVASVSILGFEHGVRVIKLWNESSGELPR
jgi:probable phosphoglycerate mutase